MMIDFRRFASGIAAERGLAGLEPVIEKEIVHLEILRSLSEHGLLESLAFQGGTCLRLCHGSDRFSEDLDFAAGAAFDSLDLDGFADALRDDLLRAYDVDVRVRPPKAAGGGPNGVGLRRWNVVVDTAPARPDIPAQRIKIEIASVPARTSVVLPAIMNYPQLPSSYSQTLIRCQKLEEIAADKLVSFSATEGYVRHRDLWDIPWILARPETDRAAISRLVALKHEDYGFSQPLADMVALGRARAASVIESREFSGQMSRFLPADVFRRTVMSGDFRALMLRRVDGAYADVARDLGIEDDVEAARRRLAMRAASGGGLPSPSRSIRPRRP